MTTGKQIIAQFISERSGLTLQAVNNALADDHTGDDELPPAIEAALRQQLATSNIDVMGGILKGIEQAGEQYRNRKRLLKKNRSRGRGKNANSHS